MNSYKQHQAFLKEQIYEAQRKYRNIRFFHRHVGLFYTKNGSPVQINRAGMSDLWALLKTEVHTYHFEIEIKTGSGVLSPKQKKWKETCEALGIKFFLVNPENPLVNQLDKFLGEQKYAFRAGESVF